MRVEKLKNEKTARKDGITGEMVKGGGDRMVNVIWRLCYIAFEGGASLKTGDLLLLFHCTKINI